MIVELHSGLNALSTVFHSLLNMGLLQYYATLVLTNRETAREGEGRKIDIFYLSNKFTINNINVSTCTEPGVTKFSKVDTGVFYVRSFFTE